MLSGSSWCLTCASCWEQLGNSKIPATESLDSDETAAASTAAEKAADTAAEKAADMAADTEAVAETLVGGFQCREDQCPDRRPTSLDYLLQDDGVDKSVETLLQTILQTINQSSVKEEQERVPKRVGKESDNQ